MTCGEGGTLLAALWCAHSLLEYWLGRTEKVKSSSVLELIVSGIAMIGILVLKKKLKEEEPKENPNGN